MSRAVFTIGYEGKNIEGFVAELRRFAIRCLIDVREIPLSRKQGFSKSALAERLERESIEYVHFKQLGSPKPVRDKLKEDGDYASFFRAMSKHLRNNADAVEKAYNYVENSRCCLMCFESTADMCHRSAVAAKIKERDGNGLMVNDI